MFGFGKAKRRAKPLACFLSNDGYSLVGLESTDQICICENHYFDTPTLDKIEADLMADVDRFNLYGRPCQVILASDLYQLILMDAPELPPDEIAQALRWQLKGLIDYPLNDIVVDAVLVPPYGTGARRKKVFTAVALQSNLIKKQTMFERCLLSIKSISIAELALSALLAKESLPDDAPVLVISSSDGKACQMHVYYQGDLYVSRLLPVKVYTVPISSETNQALLLEIQRSIDYCLMELKFTEPKQVLFTPNFYQVDTLLSFLQSELKKEVRMMDVNAYFKSDPISKETMAKAFYAVGGALMQSNGDS